MESPNARLETGMAALQIFRVPRKIERKMMKVLDDKPECDAFSDAGSIQCFAVANASVGCGG
jgi:hypothetical protein